MKLLFKAFTSLALIFILAGCAHQIVEVRPSSDTAAADNSSGYFLGIGNKDIDAVEICGDKGVGRVETHKTFGSTVISVLTLFLYHPTKYRVYCAS